MLDLTKSFNTFPIIQTERLHLRQLVPGDAEALLVVFSDPKVMAGHGTPVHESLVETLRLIDWYTRAFTEKRALRWAITRHSDNTVLGTCGYHEITAYHHRAEIGYELASAEWRQGIMSEAVRAVVRFGLEQMGFHRIEAIVDPSNPASANLLRKVGFTEEGYLRERFFDNGRFVNDWFFSILATEVDKVR
ncbi:MAG: GNAT family N-acetyltransferase [Anaerolineaceae bacterium]|nr:GNAT family N-acetyltransferase [Anaerolineaceae bacterium]